MLPKYSSGWEEQFEKGPVSGFWKDLLYLKGTNHMNFFYVKGPFSARRGRWPCPWLLAFPTPDTVQYSTIIIMQIM